MAFASSCSQAQPAPESKLALNLSFQEGTAPGSSLNEKFDYMESMGITGFEPGGTGLAGRVSEIQQALKGRNIKVSAICAGFKGFILSEKPEIRKECMDTMKEIIAAAGELGRAVGRLERDADEGQRRTDVDDRAAVAGSHHRQRGAGPPDLTEERDLDGPLEVRGGDVPAGREHRGHGVVHPHVDRSELGLDPVRGPVHLLGVGDVGGDGQGSTSLGAHVGRRPVQTRLPPGQKRDVVAVSGERDGGGPPDAGRGTGDDCDLVFGHPRPPCWDEPAFPTVPRNR